MKKVFIMFLLAILPISTLQVSAFSDIQNSEFKPYIEQMLAEKLVSGYDDGLFRPSNPVSFAESLKIVINTTRGVQNISSKQKWYDYYEEIYKKEFLQNEKIFAQGQNITRDFAMYIILRNLGIDLENKKIPNQFPDVKDSSIFANYINFAKMNGIVSGYSNGRFGPNNLVTRGEFAKMTW